jgi:protoporphyrinogen oxidase
MIYDIIILGGGIAGLYSAYKLLQKNENLKILILEKNDYLGGRMKTYQKTINGITYYQEEGAWRFNSNHKLLLKLIHELGLKDNLRNLDLKKDFIPSTKYDEKFINIDPTIYINKIIEYSKKDEKSTIQSYTLKEYSKKILKKDELKFFIDSFGYYKILDINAYDGILLLESGLKFNLKFYTIYPGVSIIIDKIKSKILENNGEIILNTNVLNIDFNEINRLFTKKEKKGEKLKILKKYKYPFNQIYN